MIVLLDIEAITEVNGVHIDDEQRIGHVAAVPLPIEVGVATAVNEDNQISTTRVSALQIAATENVMEVTGLAWSNPLVAKPAQSLHDCLRCL